MDRKIKLIIMLIFGICVLLAIIAVPQIGVVVAIIAALVLVYKKICHRPF